MIRLARGFERQLARVRKPDALLLALHGAQTAEGVDDVAGALLASARRVLGGAVPIVVALDLHANVTRAMVTQATALVGYHSYPHIDLYETGVKAARLLLQTLAGRASPVMAFRKLPMIVPAENMQTTSGPMHRLIQRGKALERNGQALAASVFGVQPWLDIQEMGCSYLPLRETLPGETGDLPWRLSKGFDVPIQALQGFGDILAALGAGVAILKSPGLGQSETEGNEQYGK